MITSPACKSLKVFFGTVLAISLSLLSIASEASSKEVQSEPLLEDTSLGELTEKASASQPLAHQTAQPLEPFISPSATVRFSTAQQITPEQLQLEQTNAGVAQLEPRSDAPAVSTPNFNGVVAARPDNDEHPLALDRTVAQTVDQTVDQTVAQTVDDTFAPLTDEEIRQQLLIDPNLEAADILDRPRPVPASNFLTPSAYGASWGEAYVGVAGATVDNDNDVDGSASIGVGFGSASDNVGVEVSTSIISLDGFADDGIVGFKLHRVFPDADNLAVAVGWANPIKWGAAQNEEDTFYGVVTQRFDLNPGSDNPLPLTASVGVGTGTFRSTGAIASGENAPNVFGSLGLRVIPEVSLISSWTGSALGLAVSSAPFEVPMVVTVGFSDLTDNTKNGTQFVGSVGYSFRF